MHHVTLTLSMATIFAFSSSGFAEQRDQVPNRDRMRSAQGAERPGTGKSDRGMRGQAGKIDPAVMVARLLKQFDADGDEKLDLGELTKLMTAMRDRRQSGGMRGRELDNGNRPKRPSQSGNRPTPTGGEQGGDRPVRPKAE